MQVAGWRDRRGRVRAAPRPVAGDEPSGACLRGADRSRVPRCGAAPGAPSPSAWRQPGWSEGVQATLQWAWRRPGPPPLALDVDLGSVVPVPQAAEEGGSPKWPGMRPPPARPTATQGRA